MMETIKHQATTVLEGVSFWAVAGAMSVVSLFLIVAAFIGGIFFLKGFLSKLTVMNQAKIYDLAIAEVERRHGSSMKSSKGWSEYNWKKQHLEELRDDSKWSKS